MNAPLPGHTVSNLDSAAPVRALLEALPANCPALVMIVDIVAVY